MTDDSIVGPGGWERELAKCSAFDIDLAEGRGPLLRGNFDYESWGSQGLGYIVDMDFVVQFLNVFGVETLREVAGKSCWVTHTQHDIKLIEPLHRKDGKPFDIHRWAEKFKDKEP